MNHTKRQTGRPMLLTMAVLLLVTVMLVQSIFVFTLSMRPSTTAYSSAYVSVNVTSAPTQPPQGPGAGPAAPSAPSGPPVSPPAFPPTPPEVPKVEACSDGAISAGETDVDCGGPCSPCETNKKCLVNNDCISGFCKTGACEEAAAPILEFPAALGLLSQAYRDALIIAAITLAIIAVGAILRPELFERALRRLLGRPTKGLKLKKRRAYRKS